MTIDEMIADLREKAAAATPGPWHRGAHYIGAGGEPHDPEVQVGSLSFRNDAALIAAAVNALPALLDEFERLRLAQADIHERELHHFEAEEQNYWLRARIEQAREAWWSATEQGDNGLIYTDKIEDAMDDIWSAIGHVDWTPEASRQVGGEGL